MTTAQLRAYAITLSLGGGPAVVCVPEPLVQNVVGEHQPEHQRKGVYQYNNYWQAVFGVAVLRDSA